MRKSKLSEIKESEPQNSKKIFSKKDRIGSTLLFEKLRDKPLKDKSLNIDHCNQKNRKSSKKEKNISKADRRKSCKRVDSLLASSQIMQVRIHEINDLFIKILRFYILLYILLNQQNWSSDKLGTNRVTVITLIMTFLNSLYKNFFSFDILLYTTFQLRSDNKAGLGIFNKGKASEKIKTKGGNLE